MSTARAPVRIGYIGSGYIARRHRNALLPTGRIIPTAVADPNRATAAYFAEIASPTIYDSHAALLEDANVDAVYICVPPAQRRPIERDVIARRLPFFVEKPLGVDLDGPTETAAEVAAAGLVHGVGYHWRHLDSLRTALERMVDRPAHLAVAQWHDGLPGAAWWRYLSQSGGRVVEQATHLIDACQVALGDVTALHALATPVRPLPSKPAVVTSPGPRRPPCRSPPGPSELCAVPTRCPADIGCRSSSSVTGSRLWSARRALWSPTQMA